eukprot:CAMPEP_0206305464 /NCGR_PEP_ID=MMETSP0106_2-20121207/10276_1 /ASSEMBLY_ACC=CAM_ASM_000206 /TAXON_ID=81532 /ORGANISM="Acanthoeca-like sp., Strain 10tr" /LENGTH=154 /DNA_ID=CAMNT_0053736311 /DNA_START=229 /DNA_END=693 /DNA_ORIENTATION=-
MLQEKLGPVARILISSPMGVKLPQASILHGLVLHSLTKFLVLVLASSQKIHPGTKLGSAQLPLTVPPTNRPPGILNEVPLPKATKSIDEILLPGSAHVMFAVAPAGTRSAIGSPVHKVGRGVVTFVIETGGISLDTAIGGMTDNVKFAPREGAL